MAENDKWVVDGYCFESEDEYNEALEEKKAIDRLMKKLNLNNKDMVVAIYSSLITEEKFSTVIGMEYLQKLRRLIIKQNYAAPEELPNIIVSHFKAGRADSHKLAETEKKIEKLKLEGRKNKEKAVSLFFVNIVLLVTIGIMMYIATTGDNINILNYEKEIKNKYAYWEISLKEREARIKEIEKQLGIDFSQ